MPSAAESDLEKKLNLKKGMKARVVGKPAGVKLSGVATTSSSAAEGVMRFRPKRG